MCFYNGLPASLLRGRLGTIWFCCFSGHIIRIRCINTNIAFLMVEKGRWIPQAEGLGMEILFYADLFVLLFADIIPYMLQRADSSREKEQRHKNQSSTFVFVLCIIRPLYFAISARDIWQSLKRKLFSSFSFLLFLILLCPLLVFISLLLHCVTNLFLLYHCVIFNSF